MPTEEQKDNEEREGGELEAGSAGRDADTSAGEGEEGTVKAAADSSAAASNEGSSDEGSEDDEASAGAAASASSARAGAGAAKKAAVRASAGARLAAAKAAKAAKKAAKKAQLAAEAEENAPPPDESLIGTGGGAPAKDPAEILAESPIGQAATKASEWAASNRSLAFGIVGALVLGSLGWVGYSWWNASQAEAAGALLTNALDITNAEIVSASATRDRAEEDRDAPTFETREARSEAALEAYRRVLAEYPSSEAATWARLGEARALFELGRYDEARQAYERALHEGGRDPVVAWRALEGIGFTYEAAQQWDEAIAKYQELRSIDDGAFEAPADYHIARMRAAKGERMEAATALRALVERLRPAASAEEPAFPYVLAQAEVRLRELDPGSSSGSGSPLMIGPGGGLPQGLEGIDPEILEQLRRQLEARGGGEGAPE